MELKDEMVDPKKAAAMLEMGIQVIDLFQKVAEAAEMVLPSPLEVLKVTLFCANTSPLLKPVS
jgi:hypothetical protein